MIRQNPAHQLRAVLSDYAARVRAFQPNARLYLLNVVILGAAMGIFRLLFNFYVLSLGYDEALLGSLITASSLTALIAALPMGYLADLLGRKNALILSTVLLGASTVGMVLWPSQGMLYALNVLSGLAQSLMGVTMAPFMMENSREQERTYLFSFSSGLQMAMASVGSWIGGYLPTWVARAGGLSPTGSQAYGGAPLAGGLSVFLGGLPLAWVRLPRLERGERSVFAPLSFAARQPVLLGKLILPMLITSIGAGVIMPFMNVFFPVGTNQPDPGTGSSARAAPRSLAWKAWPGTSAGPLAPLSAASCRCAMALARPSWAQSFCMLSRYGCTGRSSGGPGWRRCRKLRPVIDVTFHKGLHLRREKSG